MYNHTCFEFTIVLFFLIYLFCYHEIAVSKELCLLVSVQENHQLRTLLKQYLDGISVNDEILSQVNPLFVVNQKTNVK